MNTHSNVSYLQEWHSLYDVYLPSFVKGVGLFLLASPFAVYFFIPAVELSDLLSHVLFVLPFISMMVYGGYWLQHSPLPTRRWPRIGHWFLGGLLAFLGLNVVMMVLMGGRVPYHLYPYWGFFAANVGGAAGLAIGIFEGRTIEQERLAERRRMRQEAARRRSKQFEDFAKIVSHDLRNPLNVAGGRLELAREEEDPAHLMAVENALGRMDEIIEDVLMLTWSAQGITAEDMEFRPLGEMAKTSWSHLDAADARLRVEANPMVHVNTRRLRRLLENLFRNAVEHGGTDVVVRVGALPDGFFVEDNGPGIPPGSRRNVFEPGVSSNEEGTGLGLSIVKTIAEAHNWTVSVTSGRDGGARFEFAGVRKKPRADRSLSSQRDSEAWSEGARDLETGPEVQ